MILDRPTLTFEKSHNFQEASFSIGDPQIILEYLRKNIYSNIKRAICQEIMSNARDAHREIGITLPIEVTLPTRMAPNWSCRDYGPGINPSRMTDVFIKFGCSTKRDSNTFTGAFGLGCKTPFAYTDTFIITTVCDIEGHRIKYQYAAVIGENRVPKLVSMAEPSHTNEHTGTTISFNVEARDHSEFARYTYEVSKFWTVRPTIHGADNSFMHIWDMPNYEYKTDTWGICERHSHNTLAVIDGIPYNINLDSIREKINDDERNLISYNSCIMFFDVGQLSVSLNREALYYDDVTVKQLQVRLRSMIAYLRGHYESVVASSKTLWEAAVTFNDAVRFFSNCSGFLKGIQWNGTIIPTKEIWGEKVVDVIHYERQSKDARQHAGRIRRFTTHPHIKFQKNTKLVFGDSKTKIEYMFEQDKTLMQVFSFRQRFGGGDYDVQWNKWLTDTNIMSLSPIDVNTLPVAPKIPRVKGVRQPHKTVKTYLWGGCDWVDTEITEEELMNGTGIYIPCFRRQAMTDNSCTKQLTTANGYGGWDGIRVNEILGVLKQKVKVYGIQKDLLGDLGNGWVCLYDYVIKQIEGIATDLKLPKDIVVDVLRGEYTSAYNHNKRFGDMVDSNLVNMPKCIIEWRTTSLKHKQVIDSGKVGTMTADVCNFLKLDNIKGHETLSDIEKAVKDACSLLKTVSYGYDATIEPHLVLYLAAVKALEADKVLVA
jgi:hypothetical protein